MKNQAKLTRLGVSENSMLLYSVMPFSHLKVKDVKNLALITFRKWLFQKVTVMTKNAELRNILKKNRSRNFPNFERNQ